MSDGTENDRARAWLQCFDADYSTLLEKAAFATHDYYYNMSVDTLQQYNEANTNSSEFRDAAQKTASSLFNISEITDERLRRQLLLLGVSGENTTADSFDNSTISSQIEQLRSLIISEYEQVSDNADLEYELKIEITSKMRDHFIELVQLQNVQALESGYNNYGEILDAEVDWDTPDIFEQVEQLWLEILPFLEQFHAYLRRKSIKLNPDVAEYFPYLNSGEYYNEILDAAYLPFPENAVNFDYLVANYTPEEIISIAEQFFTSLGYPALPQSFWNLSIFYEDPTRVTNCYGQAHDFSNGKDYAITYCLKPTWSDFVSAHHEMGHIYYYMAYASQPALFRLAAHDAFHEAIGDTIVLSLYTVQYLDRFKNNEQYEKPSIKVTAAEDTKNLNNATEKLEVINKLVTNQSEVEMNLLIQFAFDSVKTLTFNYILDSWRSNVYSGQTPFERMSSDYQELYDHFFGNYFYNQTNESAFDPGQIFHIAHQEQTINYFIAIFLKFQFHAALCAEINSSVPIHQCTLAGDKKAGAKLWDMLKKGISEPWPDTLEAMTGSKNITAKAFLEYYAPLHEWLKRENEAAGECYGWGAEWPNATNLPVPRCSVPETNVNETESIKSVHTMVFTFDD